VTTTGVVAAPVTTRRVGRLALDRPAALALVLGLAGFGYRLVLTVLTVPATNSDEAITGLAARHIVGGRLPIYFYGQHYMGALESYLAAALFAVFGSGTVLLRVPILLLYAAFLLVMYRLTRRLYSPWLAVVTVGLLALGSDRVLKDQLIAGGGYPEINPAGALLMLLATVLGQRAVRRRRLVFAAFGLVAGLAVWDDWLVLPYLAAAGALLLFGCWRELRGRTLLVVIGGFLLGVLPLILDNLTSPLSENSLAVFLRLNAGGSFPYADRLHGAVMLGVPLATGLCAPGHCSAWGMWWGVLYLPLLLLAAVLAGYGLRRAGTGPDPDRPQRRIRYAGQLALAVAGALSLAAYSHSPSAAATPIESARYLAMLQTSTPAVLWPLWLAARRVRSGRRGWLPGSGGIAVLAGLTAAMVAGTGTLLAHAGEISDQERRQRSLARTVRRAGITYTYAEYWTCNRLTFLTREQVLCATIGDDLRPGQDRYPPYALAVHRADRPAFVLQAGARSDLALRGYLRQHGIDAQVTEVGGYRIYQPAATVKPWQ
jgi:4-amino-4-deoxy-L-arabinose transferase-like glycosyltransferase